MTQRIIHIGSVLLIAVLLAALPPVMRAQAPPCCSITAIDVHTGVVSAKEIANQETFQFKVTDAKVLAGLHVGQAVYANFTTKQVSLDGKKMVGSITSPPQAPAVAKGGPGAATGKPLGAQRVVGGNIPRVAFGVPKLSIAEQPMVTVLAKAEHNEWDLKRLNAVAEGKPIQVDYFRLRGIDGIQKAEGLPQAVRDALLAHASQTSACGVAPRFSTPLPPVKGALPNSRVPSKSLAAAMKQGSVSPAPQASCGEIPLYVVNKQAAEEWAKTHTPLPKTLSPLPRTPGQPEKLKPRGAAGLTGRVRVLPTAYSLDSQLPQIPTADDIQKAGQHAIDEGKRQGQKIIDQGKQFVENPGQTASAWAEHWKKEATNDWEKMEDCWTDHTISLTQPLEASPIIGFMADLASLKVGQGRVNFQVPIKIRAQAEVSLFYIPCMAIAGAVTGMPIGDLPFVLRPRNLAVGELDAAGQPISEKGHIEYGTSVDANIQYVGYMGSKAIPIPLSGLGVPPTFPNPTKPFFFTVGPVPVEWSAFLVFRGRINVSGEVTPSVAGGIAAGGAVAGPMGAVAGGVAGTAAGTTQVEFTASSSKEGPFWFECNGSGCKSDFSKILETPTPPPRFVTHGTGLGARLVIEPAIFVGAQVELYFGLIAARAGIEPAITADLWGFEGTGCGTSGTGGTSGLGGDNVKALTADIDANVYLPWEVNVLGTTDPFTGDYMTLSQEGVPSAFVPSPLSDKHLLWQKHLLFKDFVGSNAISPLVAANGSAAVARPAAYRVKMRPCYPYGDDVEYQLQWGGSGSAAPQASGAGPSFARAFQPALGATNGPSSIWGSPQKDFVFNHTWGQAGDFTLAITPVQDKHGRQFAPPPQTSQLTVHVQGQSKAGAQSTVRTPSSKP